MSSARLPLWLKLAFSLWIMIWMPTYVVVLGPQNFFWLCNIANFLVLAALWTESRRLMSMQWLAVLLVGIVWPVDVVTALLTGIHPIGGTEYMFDPDHPTVVKILSLYHVVVPLVVLFAISRLGYDRQAFYWQSALTLLVLPLTYLFTEAERNINWVHGPFGQPQEMVDPWLYLVAVMILTPLVLYLPAHLLMILVRRWRSRR
jgi:hypothetical protein